MKNEVEQKVQELATPIIENLGYELVDVEYSSQENGMNLTIFIHKNGGITLDDCQTVARKLDEPLDELNPTKDEHYYFNVSSVGLDRPLKTEKDFLRNLGNEIDVTYLDEKEKKLQGTLKEVIDSTLTLNCKGKITKINIDKVVKAYPTIKF